MQNERVGWQEASGEEKREGKRGEGKWTEGGKGAPKGWFTPPCSISRKSTLPRGLPVPLWKYLGLLQHDCLQPSCVQCWPRQMCSTDSEIFQLITQQSHIVLFDSTWNFFTNFWSESNFSITCFLLFHFYSFWLIFCFLCHNNVNVDNGTENNIAFTF